MRILFLSNKDLASNFALNMLLPEISRNHEVHLWLSAKVGKNSVLPKQLQTLKFFEQDLFNKLLSPLLPNSENRSTYKSFDGFSPFLHSEIREVNQINSPEIIGDLTKLSPDLIVSIRYGGILKETVINIPTKGVINLHSGVLPKYKGVMATFWAMKNNDSQVGTTLHTIDDGSIDTGQVFKISKMKVERTKSSASIRHASCKFICRQRTPTTKLDSRVLHFVCKKETHGSSVFDPPTRINSNPTRH